MACAPVELSEAVDEDATGDTSAKQRSAGTLRCLANLYRVHLLKADSFLLPPTEEILQAEGLDELLQGPSELTKLCTDVAQHSASHATTRNYADQRAE